jgi:hypothetical protein
MTPCIQIETADTVLGWLVTVFLIQTIDSGSTITLLVPTVNLPPSKVANIATEGIMTLHKFAIVKPPLGQSELLHRPQAPRHGKVCRPRRRCFQRNDQAAA